MVFDPSLHETPEQAADDESTTYLLAAEVELGEFWDPDLEASIFILRSRSLGRT
jgi:hypothetical protein